MKQQEHIITVVFLSVLIIFNIWMIGFGKQPWIISSLNIFFHEAGHLIFSLLGRDIGVLGGTLGELLIPTLFVGYFSIYERIPGKVFSLWWLTTAFYSVAIYMADARVRILPLIGGQEGHDWAYLFGITGLLRYDMFFSKIIIIIALCITVYMTVLIYRYYELSRGKIIS